MARGGNGEADDAEVRVLLARIADALDRAAPAEPAPADLGNGEAFVWHAEDDCLVPVHRINRVDLELLVGIDRPAATLMENTRRFARGLPANNALLWGARGMGKSSLVKSVHGSINAEIGGGLGLVEVHREDLGSLPVLLAMLRAVDRRFILFCDDLSFEAEDTTFKSLKALLEGGIEGRPPNVIFYATSNRRHLMPREMIENEQSTAIAPARRSTRRSRCRTDSASGWASTTATRKLISASSRAMPAATASRFPATGCGRRRRNGR